MSKRLCISLLCSGPDSWRRVSSGLVIVLACCFWPLLVQAAPFGNPPVTRFYPSLDVYPQNFDITTGIHGEILVANDDGILIFDGERWKLLPLPNGDMVRALSRPVKTPDGGRIYVGGYDMFGYLKLQASGEYRFVDLTQQFSDDLPPGGFADIWDIVIGEQGVLFRAVKHAFLYDPGSPSRRQAWHWEGRFGAAFEMEGRLYMPFRGNAPGSGLRMLQNGEWTSAPDGGTFSGLIYKWLPLNDGRWLALQADGSWQAYAKNGASRITMPAGFPPASRFSNGLALPNGELALTSDQGELYFLNLRNNSYRKQRISNRYLSGLHRHDSGLLIVDDEAIHHVSWPARWLLLDETQGITGSLHKAVQWGSRWLLLGSSGIQEIDSRNGEIRFVHRDWTEHEAWDLLLLDEEHALLAESYELKLLFAKSGKVTSISLNDEPVYPRLLYRSRFNPEIVFAGTELGLLVLRLSASNSGELAGEILLRLDELDAPRVNSIVETGEREIWFGSERGGIYRLELNADWRSAAKLQRIGPAEGLQYGDIRAAEIFLLGEQLLASTDTGLFAWNGSAFAAEEFAGLQELQDSGERLSLRQAPSGELWAFDYRQLFCMTTQGEWHEEIFDVPLRSAIMDIVFAGEQGKAVIVAGNAILQFQGHDVTRFKAPQVRLVQIQRVLQNTAPVSLPLKPAESPVFTHDNVTLSFSFSLQDFHATQSVLYQARLLPLEPEFSNWSPVSSFTYYRLEPGMYSFEVRARDGAGIVTAAEPYEFEVKPRWFNSLAARTAWLLLLLGFLSVLVRQMVHRRLRRLREDKLHLEKTVAARTRELESANRQLQAMAHLDGLTEIANRRRLDEYLAEVWQQCREHNRPLSLLVIDVDHFKEFNDRFGHVAGDRLLQNLARMLSQNLRRSEDLVARYGGEEFLVVLPGARIEAASELAEAMREHVEVSSLGATISIGVATGMHAATGNVTALVNAADKALYAAKAAGRNCVRIAED